MSSESDISASPDVVVDAPPVGRVWNVFHYAIVYSVFAGALWYIQSGTAGIIDPDGYYHIRWTQMLWQTLPSGHLPKFVWLPLTILNEQRYVDHHFLFHIFQIPFTWGSDLVAGAKASAVIYGALAMLACYLLISAGKVRYSVAWMVFLLASSGPFLFRMSLPRAPAATVVTLILAFWLLFTKRYIWLGVLSFLLVWMYSLFPLVSIIAGAWAVGVWFEEGRIEWKPVAATLVGIGLGLLVNPYFPENILLFVDHVKMKTAGDYEISVGNEWYPYESWYLVISSMIAWVAQITGWLTQRPERKEDRAKVIALMLFSTFLLLLTMKSRRFIEYWPPFAVVYAAYALKPHLDRWTWSAIPSGIPRAMVVVGLLFLAGVTGSLAVINVVETRKMVEGESDPNVYAGAAKWMRENTPEGSLVFNTDWDDFPMLFYHDTHNVYTSGLDPTYLLHADANLSELYVDITLGHEENAAPIIRDTFGARYAFTDSGHKDFIRNVTANGEMRIVYEDDDAVVLEVNDTVIDSRKKNADTSDDGGPAAG